MNIWKFFTYVDAISLVCLTLSRIQEMLQICEEYALITKLPLILLKVRYYS